VALGGMCGAQANTQRAVPEAARQSYVQANVIYKNSQDDADIRTAIGLYNDAVAKAPWFSDAWFNLSLAQEKLGDYAGAVSSMQSLQPLEAGGPNERRDLDRIYTLLAEEKLNDARHSQQATLGAAASKLRKAVGGYTMYKFFLGLDRNQGPISRDEERNAGILFVFRSDQYGFAGHDGFAIGAQATVDTDGKHVVLTLGTQRLCIPPDQVGAIFGPALGPIWEGNVNGVTDCSNPQGYVFRADFMDRAWSPDGNQNLPSLPGTATLALQICPDSECRHIDIVTYWLRP